MIEELNLDPWRDEVGFSDDLREAQDRMFDNPEAAGQILSRWLESKQPCFFGKTAAKFGLLRFCIISEDDCRSDEAVRDKIQKARKEWTRAAFNGQASGFVVLLLSRSLTRAIPNNITAEIARRFGQLYLREVDVQFDQIHHERIWLEKPGSSRLTWQWLAGVNVFSAQGDKRWWHDHRIPGGIAFSVNSVGHMIKSAKINKALAALNADFGVPENEEQIAPDKFDSLTDALQFAMLTIANAQPTVSGPATSLVNEPDDVSHVPTCPFERKGKLKGKSHCTYQGWYHTDHTLPSIYFTPAVERPSAADSLELDFTYLFDNKIDNPAFESMGVGLQVRADSDGNETREVTTFEQHRQKAEAREVSTDECPELIARLQ